MDIEQKNETKQCQRCGQVKPLEQFREMTTKITNNCVDCLERVRIIREIKHEIDYGIQHEYSDDPQTIIVRRYLCDYDTLCKIIKNYIRNKYPTYIFRVIDRLDYSDYEVVIINGESLKYRTTQFYAKHFPNIKNYIELFTIDEMDNKIDACVLQIETRFSESILKYLENGYYRYFEDLRPDYIEYLNKRLENIKTMDRVDRDVILYQLANEIETMLSKKIYLPKYTAYELLRAVNDNYPNNADEYYINGLKFEHGVCIIDWGC
jgi:hypothetical protein